MKFKGETKDYAVHVSIKTILDGLTHFKEGLNLSSRVRKPPNKLWIFAKDFLLFIS